MGEKRVIIGSDHAGFEVKTALIRHLIEKGYDVTDSGTFSTESCDYPAEAHKLCVRIQSGEFPAGILLCGTGIGMSIAANKVKGIRAAVCWNKETAALIAQHNNANIICLGARFLSVEEICEMIKTYLETKFEERHLKRINKIKEIEQK